MGHQQRLAGRPVSRTHDPVARVTSPSRMSLTRLHPWVVFDHRLRGNQADEVIVGPSALVPRVAHRRDLAVGPGACRGRAVGWRTVRLHTRQLATEPVSACLSQSGRIPATMKSLPGSTAHIATDVAGSCMVVLFGPLFFIAFAAAPSWRANLRSSDGTPRTYAFDSSPKRTTTGNVQAAARGDRYDSARPKRSRAFAR